MLSLKLLYHLINLKPPTTKTTYILRTCYFRIRKMKIAVTAALHPGLLCSVERKVRRAAEFCNLDRNRTIFKGARSSSTNKKSQVCLSRFVSGCFKGWRRKDDGLLMYIHRKALIVAGRLKFACACHPRGWPRVNGMARVQISHLP